MMIMPSLSNECGTSHYGSWSASARNSQRIVSLNYDVPSQSAITKYMYVGLHALSVSSAPY
jgi:hypothetical protein